MLKFRWIFYLLGLVVIIYFIKKAENKVENSDEFVHQKKRELEDLLRKIINKEIEQGEFLETLKSKFELNSGYEDNLIVRFFVPRAFLGNNSQENMDDFKYLLLVEPALYQFMERNIDELGFYELIQANYNQCKKRTWEIKIFENTDGVRDFSLYRITKKQEDDAAPIKNL